VTRIGEAKENLSNAIRDEFSEFRGRLEELSKLGSDLSSDAGGINGLAGFWRSISQQIESMAATIAERERDVLAALTGKSKHEIRITVDVEQSERVKAAREGGEEGPREGAEEGPPEGEYAA
jgi:hypothetical protein